MNHETREVETRLHEAAPELLDIAKRYVAIYPGAAGQPRAFFDGLYEDAVALITRIEPDFSARELHEARATDPANAYERMRRTGGHTRNESQ